MAVAAVVAALAMLPSAAGAVPPSNDDFFSAIRLNQPGQTLPRTGSLSGTTAEATLQGGEFIQCIRQSDNATVDYGATVWYEFYPDRPGNLTIATNSGVFLIVVGVGPFNGSNLTAGPCDVGNGFGNVNLPLTGLQEDWGYKIQIGGYDPDGEAGATLPGQGAFTMSWQFTPDTDRDGILDGTDLCPTQGGIDVAKYRGCPDNDRDGVPEGSGGRDKCPGLAGYNASLHDGCPDNDRDGIPEGAGGSDRCPGKTGYKADEHRGCPDDDRDGIPEGPGQADLCVGTNPDTQGRPDRNNDGCSDHIRIQATASFLFSTTSTGVRITRYFKLTRVPQAAKVSIACKLPSGRKCAGGKKVARTKREGTVSAKKLKGRRPAGTQIIARVTASNATARYIRITFSSHGYKCRGGSSPSKAKNKGPGCPGR